MQELYRDKLWPKYHQIFLADVEGDYSVPDYDLDRDVVFGPRGVLLVTPDFEAKDEDDDEHVEIVVYLGPGTPEGEPIGSGVIEVGDKEISTGDIIGGGELIPWPPGRTSVTIYLTMPPAVKVPRYAFALEHLDGAVPIRPEDQSAEQRAEEIFDRFAHDDNWSTGAVALGRLGEAALPVVLRAASDPDWEVRQLAAEALGHLHDSRAVEPLIMLLSDENHEVRQRAAHALTSYEDKRACEPLIRALTDPDRQVKDTAASALKTCGDERAVEPLLQVLDNRDEWGPVRWSAAWTLGALGDERALGPLLDALRERDHNFNARIRTGLRELGLMAVEPLLTLLTDRDWHLRRQAALALGELAHVRGVRDPRAIAPLLHMLTDRREEVRSAAELALGKIADERAVEPLLNVLQNGTPLARATAAEALGNIGDPRALPALEKARETDHADAVGGVPVSAIAAQAILWITARRRALERDPEA